MMRVPDMKHNMKTVTLAFALLGCLCAPGLWAEEAATARAGNGARMKLHETPWSVAGMPILGTYMGGGNVMDDLRQIQDVGMNVIIAGEPELDPKTPEGAFCRDSGIKVMYHLTHYLYHGVKLREAVAPDRTAIPLYFTGKVPDHASHVVKLDEELIRYESMTEDGLLNCERGYQGTVPAEHREGVILFWPEECAAEVETIKNSPNLFGYYVLDDSPGDALSALKALYQTVRDVDPSENHPVCAGFGDAGSVQNFAPGVCDLMMIYWYPVSSKSYGRESTSLMVQLMMSAARERVPGIPFVGVYQAFDGSSAQTGQGVPTAEQLREQLEDFVREGASGLIAFINRAGSLSGWADFPELEATIKQVDREIRESGGLTVRPETEAMKKNRIQPAGYWEHPNPLPGVVPAWYVVGPFEDTADKMLEASFPPDNTVDLNATYPVKFGSSRWRVRPTTCGMLGMSNLYGDHSKLHKCIDYAYCEVVSPKEQQVQMRIGSDDDAWIRLNDTQVYQFQGSRGLEFDTEAVSVTLPEGRSRILAKVYNRAGMWGLFVRFTDTNGKPLDGLKFTPTVE